MLKEILLSSALHRVLVQKFHHKKRKLRYCELDLHTKSTAMHRFYCPACQSLDCPKCGKQHTGGEGQSIIMFCRGHSTHVKHWFHSAPLCYPDRPKTLKELTNEHWYCCELKSSTDHDPLVDYVSSETAAILLQTLNNEENFPVNYFTHNGISLDIVNSVNKKIPYDYQNHLLEMGYDRNDHYPKHYKSKTVTTMLEITNDVDCFIETH